jgi:hypothetical protein
MGQINTRDIVLLGITTVTTSGTGPDTNMIQAWQAATITLNVATVSGTLPTLDVYIQRKFAQAAAADVNPGPPTGTAIYDDLLHFTQLTTSTSVRLANVVTIGTGISTVATPTTTGPADYAQSDAALGAGILRVGPIGGLWRVKYVISGTTPSIAFSVVAQLVPFST